MVSIFADKLRQAVTESNSLLCVGLDPDPEKQGPSIFPEGSVIIDPWRKCPSISGCEVVHYGNTRLKK